MTLIRMLVMMKEEEVEKEEEEEDSTRPWLALMATVTDENNLVKNKQRRQSKLHICLKAQNIKCLNIKKCTSTTSIVVTNIFSQQLYYLVQCSVYIHPAQNYSCFSREVVT